MNRKQVPKADEGYNWMAKNREKEIKYSTQFYNMFHHKLHDFMDYVTGFDIIRFDEKIIKPPNGVSTKEAIQQQYGLQAVELIQNLL